MSNHPLSNMQFHDLLHRSQSACEHTGWVPKHFKLNDSFLPTYIKGHSYGEYIFDWAWADFYQKNQISYYPKMIHAIPFTPVNAPKLLGDTKEFKKLLQQNFDFYQQMNLSSDHFLFINDQEENLLKEMGYTIQKTHQYHFKNKYTDFGHFLGSLKKNKRKNIKKERKKVQESDLEIKRLTKNQITQKHLEELYHLYTINTSKRGSHPYLTKEFFLGLLEYPIMLTSAQKAQKTIAMALFFYDDKVLYGRNWGMHTEYEEHYPYLHFELCYYQGIEFVIEKNLEVFEAGAQGEHKLIRGFEPVIIKSAHHIKIPQCYEIIKQDINHRNQYTAQAINELTQYLPFKTKG